HKVEVQAIRSRRRGEEQDRVRRIRLELLAKPPDADGQVSPVFPIRRPPNETEQEVRSYGRAAGRDQQVQQQPFRRRQLDGYSAATDGPMGKADRESG